MAMPGSVMDDVPIDAEDPIDEWISIGFRRGVMVGACCSLMTIAVLAAGWWMF